MEQGVRCGLPAAIQDRHSSRGNRTGKGGAGEVGEGRRPASGRDRPRQRAPIAPPLPLAASTPPAPAAPLTLQPLPPPSSLVPPSPSPSPAPPSGGDGGSGRRKNVQVSADGKGVSGGGMSAGMAGMVAQNRAAGAEWEAVTCAGRPQGGAKVRRCRGA